MFYYFGIHEIAGWKPSCGKKWRHFVADCIKFSESPEILMKFHLILLYL